MILINDSNHLISLEFCILKWHSLQYNNTKSWPICRPTLNSYHKWWHDAYITEKLMYPHDTTCASFKWCIHIPYNSTIHHCSPILWSTCNIIMYLTFTNVQIDLKLGWYIIFSAWNKLGWTRSIVFRCTRLLANWSHERGKPTRMTHLEWYPMFRTILSASLKNNAR